MESRGYTLIQDWMLDLPLSYREIAIYAIIYGFSQDGETKFEGSIGYLAKKTKSTKNTARSALHKLMDEGLIERTIVNKNGVEFHTYRVNLMGTAKIAGGMQKLEGGTQKIAPNNKEDNKVNICVSNKASRNFNPPTHAEVSDYCRERMNAVNVDAFMAYYESNGWMVGKNRMKDWKAAVRTWEQRENRQPQGRPAPVRKESNRERLDRIAQEMFGGGFRYGCEEQ